MNVTREKIQGIAFVHVVVNCAKHRAVNLMTKRANISTSRRDMKYGGG